MRRGLTLIEVMLVACVVVIVGGLLAPAVQSSREADRRTQCRNNLHRLAVAFHNYHDAHAVFPPAFTCRESQGKATAEVGWGVQLLPFVEEKKLYRQYDFDKPAWDGPNEKLSQNYIKQYECPTQATSKLVVKLGDKKLALTSYQPCWGSDLSDPKPKQRGICTRNSSTKLRDIKDGTSQTLLFGEVLSADQKGVPDVYDKAIPNFWAGAAMKADFPIVWVGGGTQFPLNSVPKVAVSSTFGSRHKRGAFFAMADGQVRFLTDTIDMNLYQALSTMAGGEIVDGKQF